MEIWLDATSSKRIDLCFDYKVNAGEVKERRFVVKGVMLPEGSGWAQASNRSFESFLEAVDYYRSLP